MKDEALKLALEALDESVDLVREDYENAKKLYSNYPSRQARLLGLEDGLSKHEAAMTAIKQALAAPVQEPVAWTLTEELEKRETTTRAHLWFSDPVNCMWTPLYTSLPAHRTWVGLTDEDIEQGCKESWVTEQAFQSAVWWAEARLKEKNV